jgi:hypothetical protein
MNNYFTKLEKYKNKIKLIQNAGYLPNCTFENDVQDNGENGMCYMNGKILININPEELPIASRNNLIINKQYIWVILANYPTRIIYCDPRPGGDISYFTCNDPNDRYGDIHHNHIARGQNIKSGGEFTPMINNMGQFYLSVNNYSGHYAPDYECLITDQPGNPSEPRDASVVFRNYGYNIFIEDDVDIDAMGEQLPQPGFGFGQVQQLPQPGFYFQSPNYNSMDE